MEHRTNLSQAVLPTFLFRLQSTLVIHYGQIPMQGELVTRADQQVRARRSHHESAVSHCCQCILLAS